MLRIPNPGFDISMFIRNHIEFYEALRKNRKSFGDSVKIEFDIQTRDKYRRLLGYVYLSNGEMLNEKIIESGYANIMTYPPNVNVTTY